jgi:hypothetical protein
VQHFALETVSAELNEFCQAAATETHHVCATVIDGLRTAAIYFRERRFLTPSRARLPDLRYEGSSN